jgi:hypothetical protein
MTGVRTLVHSLCVCEFLINGLLFRKKDIDFKFEVALQYLELLLDIFII